MDAGSKRVHACTCGRMFVCVCVCVFVRVCKYIRWMYSVRNCKCWNIWFPRCRRRRAYALHNTFHARAGTHLLICDLTRRYARMNPRMGSRLDGCFNGWTQRWMVDRPVDYDGTNAGYGPASSIGRIRTGTRRPLNPPTAPTLNGFQDGYSAAVVQFLNSRLFVPVGCGTLVDTNRLHSEILP